MIRNVTPKRIKEIARFSATYDKFRGVDFSTDATQVKEQRSPLCKNVISDMAGFPEKRLGWRTIHRLGPGRVHGMYVGSFPSGYVNMLHVQNRLYIWTEYVKNWNDWDALELSWDDVEAKDSTWDELEAPERVMVYEDMNDHDSAFFTHSGKVYILDGAHYLVVQETEAGEGTYSYSVTNVSDYAFVPTTVIGAPATGGGVPFEPVNLLTGTRRNSMIGNAKDKTFQLDSGDLESVDEVKIEGIVVDPSEYEVDLEKGTITFDTAPPISSAGSGVDNIEVTLTRMPGGYAERITKCTIVATYGYNQDNRFWVSGNPDSPNTDWYSNLDDPAYFPDTGYTNIGSSNSAIMGYLKQYDSLIVVKEDDVQDAELYIRNSAMDSNGKLYFPVKQGVKGMGAVSRKAFGILRDDPMFLSREGVFAVVSATISQERTLQDRSYYVNAQLTKEQLSQAVAVVWNGYYILCINGVCYVADSRQKSTYQVTEQYGYEWYYWTNIPAVVFMEHEGELFFGTDDGRVCKFNTDIYGMNKYSDDGEPIEAIWTTKMDDMGDFMYRKSLMKKGCGVMIKPYTRSSIEIFVDTDKEMSRFLRGGTMDLLDFGDIDFERLTFNANDNPQVVPFNRKVKKFILLQCIFRNAEVDEGFGVFGCKLQYTRAGFVK